MPELTQVYQNTTNFADASWASDDVFIADCTYVSFTVHCSVSCVMSLNWKIDGTSDMAVETKNVLANTATTIYSPVKSRYIYFQVDTFNSVPCDLKTQAFFF